MASRLPKPGDVWHGPVAYSDDYELVPRPGYYALDEDGRQVQTEIRLTWVDCAPGNERDGTGYYEVSDKGSPISRAANDEDLSKLYDGHVVELKAQAKGKSNVKGAK